MGQVLHNPHPIQTDYHSPPLIIILNPTRRLKSSSSENQERNSSKEMEALFITFEYKPQKVKWLSKLADPKIKREVKAALRDFNVPNLSQTGTIDLAELKRGDRLVSVECHGSNCPTPLAEELQTLQMALASSNSAKIRKKRGIVSIDYQIVPSSPVYVPCSPEQILSPEIEAQVLAERSPLEGGGSLSPQFPSSESPLHSESNAKTIDALQNLSLRVFEGSRSPRDEDMRMDPPQLEDTSSLSNQPNVTGVSVSAPSERRLSIKKPRYELIETEEDGSQRAVPRRRATSDSNDQDHSEDAQRGSGAIGDLPSSSPPCSFSPSPSPSTDLLGGDRGAIPEMVTIKADSLTRIRDAFSAARGHLDLAIQRMDDLEEAIRDLAL